jgi:hypothetical protein
VSTHQKRRSDQSARQTIISQGCGLELTSQLDHPIQGYRQCPMPLLHQGDLPVGALGRDPPAPVAAERGPPHAGLSDGPSPRQAASPLDDDLELDAVACLPRNAMLLIGGIRWQLHWHALRMPAASSRRRPDPGPETPGARDRQIWAALVASSADEREHSCANQREADRGETDDAESQKVDPRKCESCPPMPSPSIRRIPQQDHGDDEPGDKPQGRRISLGSHDEQVSDCYCGGDGSRNDRPQVPRPRQRLTHADRLPAASTPCPDEHRYRTPGCEIGRSGASARRLDLLRLSRLGKISGDVVEGRKRTAWLAHSSTATAVVWTKFVGFKGDCCSSTENAKTDNRAVALLLNHSALKPLEGPPQHLDSITLSPTAH